MLRTGVSIYLMLVTLAGPGLCCCTLTQHRHRLPSTAKQKPLERPCCCHRQAKAPSQSTPVEPKKPCPCKEHGAMPVAFLQNQSCSAQQLDFAEQLHYFADVASLACVNEVPSPVASQQSPVLGMSGCLTAQDLLRALHILLC
jgi:hypothetical protein